VIAPPTVERSAIADDTPPSDPCRKLRRSMVRNPSRLQSASVDGVFGGIDLTREVL
jgi:hypothetical protein